MENKRDNTPMRGPLQIVHDFKFTALNVKDDYSVLDSLDKPGKLEYVKSRLDRLFKLGYGGVVMNVDYKSYLKDPDAFTLFFEYAEYAKSLGMRVWIYDEQYYPSGSAGGLTLVGHPELEALALACVAENVTKDDTVGAIRIPSPLGYSELKYAVAAPIRNGEVIHGERTVISECKDLGGGLCFDAPNGEWRVWCFFMRPLYELTKLCQGTRASRRSINVFNKKAVEQFYKVTFEDGYCAYKKGKLGELVDAVFTDEPYSPFYAEYLHDYGKTCRTIMPSSSIYDKPHRGVEIYPYVPWETSLDVRYFEKYGRSVVDTLPDLFDETPKTKQARIDLYTLLSEMAREAFPKQMSDKLAEEGVMLSGHYYGEELFDMHPIFFGDILEHLCEMKLPGCDCLWSDLDLLRDYTALKIASSAAHLAGHGDVMIEASNMVDPDQNITLPRLKAAISTMFAHGINRITSYYSERLLPDEEMQEFTEHVSRLSNMLDGGKYRSNTLLYYPFENLAADRAPLGFAEIDYRGEDHLGIKKTASTLIKHQIPFDFINKKRLLGCKIKDNALISPSGEKVKYVLIPSLDWLDGEVASFLSEAVSHGVEIIFDGEKRKICNVTFTKRYLCDGYYPKTELAITNDDPYILSLHKSFNGFDRFMLVNTEDTDKSLNISLDLADGESLKLVNIKSGDVSTPEYTEESKRAQLTVGLPALEAIIIERSKENS